MDIERGWQSLWDALERSSVELNALLATMGVSGQRNASAFVKAFDKVKAEAERLDGVVRCPIAPLAVDMPWQERGFLALWAYWKDYRLEKFRLTYTSREERKALEYLRDIAGGDCGKAEGYLDFAMAKGYRNFFVPGANAKYQPDVAVNAEGERPF